MRGKRANFHDGSCRGQAHHKPNVRTQSRPSKCKPILLIGGSPCTHIRPQPIPRSRITQDHPGKPGGVHIRLCQNGWSLRIDETCLGGGRGFSIAATRTSNHSRRHRKGSTTPYGSHARIAVITASEPSSLITRFMLYASTCKLISVLTRPMVRVRK